MKAMVRDSFGGSEVLQLREIERPSMGDEEVLVRVHASSVTVGDWFWLTGTPAIMRPAAGMLKPRDPILGRDLAGVVEEVGASVTDLAPGDEVYGEAGFGAHAEFVAVPADKLARKPASLDFEEAAAVPIGGVTALQGLRDAGRIKPRQRVLINGASGAVGTFAVQIAKAYETEVTAVCSADCAELIRTLGADHVIDYTREDFTTGSVRYDLIFDLAGSKSVGACRSVLTPDGVYVASTSRLGVLLRAVAQAPFAKGQVAIHSAKESRADLEALCDLIEKGALKPVIDGRYRLEEVPQAFRQQGLGHARGRKVVTIQPTAGEGSAA